MATALARVLSDDLLLETLILCPRNFVEMWEDYRHQYRLASATVLSYSRVIRELPELRRHRLVILDESHNLRNREGKVYKTIAEYIQRNDSKRRCLSQLTTPIRTTLSRQSVCCLFLPCHKASISERLLFLHCPCVSTKHRSYGCAPDLLIEPSCGVPCWLQHASFEAIRRCGTAADYFRSVARGCSRPLLGWLSEVKRGRTTHIVFANLVCSNDTD